uniref:acetyl-CoA carboxytransferase n=2 Tax=Sar TaxID=2698737 RepID=A0A7S3Y4I5_HETAK
MKHFCFALALIASAAMVNAFTSYTRLSTSRARAPVSLRMSEVMPSFGTNSTSGVDPIAPSVADLTKRLSNEGSIELFKEVASVDFLNFGFGGSSYAESIKRSVQKTETFAGVTVELKNVKGEGGNELPIVFVQHNFAFLGGSLGCAEGEKVTRAFEFATANGLPIVVQCKSGGARMQEGTLSLMQMAKVSVAVDAHRRAKLPFITLLNDPTYGGVSASYAMQSDVRIGVSDARIGFAGPQVILNTMFEMDQSKYDAECPEVFQSSEYLKEHGQLDMVLQTEVDGVKLDLEEEINKALYKVISPLYKRAGTNSYAELKDMDFLSGYVPTEAEINAPADYTKSRSMDRYQGQDLMMELFTDFVELSGDGRVGTDPCMKGGLAKFNGMPVVVVGSTKGHSPKDMKDANYGMSSPAGYRTALRLMKLAERFDIPVISIVDTCGAWPSFVAERDGQSEAIATNLVEMAGLKVPMVTVVLGEGGSGGALAIGMGNKVGMMSRAYYGVISPEGASSILGRYKDEEHKKVQFPKDCQELANVQKIYPAQLKELNVIDDIIVEAEGETYENFPATAARIQTFIKDSLLELGGMSSSELINQRYEKFRGMGKYAILSEEEQAAVLKDAAAIEIKKKERVKVDTTPSKIATYIAEKTILGDRSRLRGLAPKGVAKRSPVLPTVTKTPRSPETAKKILDSQGPEALAAWVKNQKRVLLTDTTMRDAHQSLLATRVRSDDLIKGAKLANDLMGDAFSFEMWGGATFDVAYRFLNEDPWERLRKIREAAPDVCLQMLIRGSNAVGYASYPDNVVREFIQLAAQNGMDVFRIFDCFNDIKQMQVSIDTVRECGKVAEVCLCYTEDINTSEVYNVEYYKKLTQQAVDAGAHIIGIKDMAGLCKPLAAKPLVEAIRSVTDLPIHFHTHATSSASLATCMEMSKAGCDIIDFSAASMADGTAQPSLNAFLASMAGDERDPMIDYLTLEPYDQYWAKIREMYSPFESGMLSGTARVYDHEIPGGQYSNLFAQCKSMGLWDRWEEVLDMYRDVNRLFGRVVKVTPSSKCVGDLALYLINRGLSAEDVLKPEIADKIDWPSSVVDLMEGKLGFPHRGFPSAVQDAVLKGKPQLTVRPGAVMDPADLVGKKTALEEQYGTTMHREDTVTSLMYSKVFSDYMDFINKYSPYITNLETPVFWYGMEIGDVTEFSIPASAAEEMNIPVFETIDGMVPVKMTLKRVTGLQKGYVRTVIFDVNGREQHVNIVDKPESDEFSGPMAKKDNEKHIGSPMPGQVEKMVVAKGDEVKAGDTLAVVGAMKMEVTVKAPHDGKIKKIVTGKGAKVIEGALMIEYE